MGYYDGKKVIEANRLKALGAREVGTFWSENAGILVVIIVTAFFIAILFGFLFFAPVSSDKPAENNQTPAQRETPRFIPPFLQFQPIPHPFPWEKKDGITPIHRPYRPHHHHYPYSYYPHGGYGAYIDVVPRFYRFPYDSGCYGCAYGRGYGDYGYQQGRRPYFRQQRPDGTITEWGLR